ncbi:MAG: L-aspartate oxidase [Eubacteriales bacterium]|nr:L-aspartate oxidase [Eubacteriales bacterium]
MKVRNADVMIVGCGVAGLFAALHLPKDKQILMITKEDLKSSDSFLAQGGICVLHDEQDYDSFMEDTLKAGHYENRRESVDIMIRSSRETINELIAWGVDFAVENGELLYTREGGHSRPRILYHEDITGEEITRNLLREVQKLPNVTILEHTAMVDILEQDNCCFGILMQGERGLEAVAAPYTIWACGGIGGLYEHSTNFPHLTGDALAIALKHGIELEHPDYVQIHPTTLYSSRPGRRFLISESVRGEGARLYGKNMERFANEVLPRDILTKEIRKQMEKDGMPYVWLDMRPLGEKQIRTHFPHIYEHCLEEGFDVTKECIPVVPAQHYFMGGVRVDRNSRTSIDNLYAAGETSCNGVHGANRLASNSLLESLVFAKRAALCIAKGLEENRETPDITALLKAREADGSLSLFDDMEALAQSYASMVKKEISRQV